LMANDFRFSRDFAQSGNKESAPTHRLLLDN
jgi:hypothetical protein